MVECYFCGFRCGMGEAIDAGWVPSFTVNGNDTGNPACPACQRVRLTYSEEFGDYELVGEDPVVAAVEDLMSRFRSPLPSTQSIRQAIAAAYRAGFQAAERERLAATEAAKL